MRAVIRTAFYSLIDELRHNTANVIKQQMALFTPGLFRVQAVVCYQC